MHPPPDYIRWYPGAIALARSLLSSLPHPHERAKDIVQQSVAQLIERGTDLGDFRQAWFFTVVRNGCIDELRRQRRYSRDEQALASTTDLDGPAEQALNREQQAQVQHALQSLSFEQREILLLRDVNDLSYATIAHILSINAGTVMSRIHRARMALRKALQQPVAEVIRHSADAAEPQPPRPVPKEAI